MRFLRTRLTADPHALARAGILLILAALLALSLPATGYANPGGGGGMSVPRGPRSDPQKDYRDGVAHLRAGEYRKAERSFRKVLRVASRDANVNYLLGMSLYMQDEKKSARRYLSKAVRYDGDLIPARSALGVVEAELGDAEAANEQLAALEKRRGECADPCANARALDEAIGKIKAALGNPSNGKGAQNHSRLRLGEMKFAAAAEGETAYLDAVRLINLGRYDTALDELAKARAALGPHPDILTYQGFANRKLRHYGRALVYYREALAIDPDHRGANEYLGEMFVEMGDLAAARTQLAKLDAICAFGCEDAEELRRWIADRES